MFERYTEEGKRAIFVAQQIAVYTGAEAIDSSHLLIGLLAQKECRANTVFSLRELLPQEGHTPTDRGKWTYIKGNIPLNGAGRRVLSQTALEANRLRDYWIDTEHFVLGILGEGNTASAAKLRDAGLDLESCRQLVVSHKDSRPSRPNPVLWWVCRRPFGFVTLAMFLFAIGVTAALILLGYAGVGVAFALIITIQIVRVVARGDGF